MKLRYRYRIYPTKEQKQRMISVGGTVRYLYNHFLKINIDQYAIDKKFVWHSDMCKQLVQLKKQYPWISETYSQVSQQALRDLDMALKNIKHSAGFPCFKSKYITPISFRYQQHTSIIDNKYVRLPKIGDIKIKLHRKLPDYTGCTITQSARGWYISFVVDKIELPLVEKPFTIIGVDVNSDYTAISNGNLIGNPKPLKKKNKKIKILQQRLSRKKKSNNRKRAIKQLARAHDRVRCQRNAHIHQISARIAKGYELVVVETLKIEQMKRNSKPVAKAIADAGWGNFILALEYKCQLNGHYFMKINQWLPSSKTCSSCGHKKSHMSLSERTYSCDECGHTEHRDINAAKNIRNYGIQQWNIDHVGQELPGVPVDVVADIIANCGEESATQMKQETVVSLDQ